MVLARGPSRARPSAVLALQPAASASLRPRPLLRLTAHTLKSNSADFGAMILSELSKKLEFMGQEEQLDGAATLIPEVQSEFEKAASILRDILKQEYK